MSQEDKLHIMSQKYVFKPYSDRFPQLFLAEKKRLLQRIGERCVDIQHVGSTAVPGLGGKGIIDIAIAIDSDDFDAALRQLKALGYEFRESGSTKERLFFRVDLPDDEGKKRYHVHLTAPESCEWKRLIAFRDYLKKHPESLEKYAELKKKSASEVNGNGILYRKLKEPFFQEAFSHIFHKVVFVIGASGSGKTTVLQHLTLPLETILLHFDAIGVPSFEEMRQEYGSLEEWQRAKTFEWMDRLVKEHLFTTHVIFDAQIRPSFIEEACEALFIPYKIILFDCSDEVRRQRLVERGHPELGNQEMMNWATYLRKECEHRHVNIINNTDLSLQQTVSLFEESLDQMLYHT